MPKRAPNPTARATVDAAAPRVAVTGADRALGAITVSRLAEQGARVTAVPTDEINEFVERLVLDDIDVLVAAHTDLSPDRAPNARHALNVETTRALLEAFHDRPITRVVVLSSAMVYGAFADNPIPLDEDAPLCAVADESVVGDLLEIEEIARRLHASTTKDVTVVRPAVLTGPDADSSLARAFEAPRLLVLRGRSPRWQFCHVEDAAEALVWAALGRVQGHVTVAAEGSLSVEEINEACGLAPLVIPTAVATAAADRLYRLNLTPAPASELAYATYPWVVPSTRLRDASWKPTYDNVAALRALIEESAGRRAIGGRRIAGGEFAALGAAGATVAAVGAAAIVRRARKNRLQ